MDMMMMQMWFYNSIKATILWEAWETKTGTQYFFSLVAVVLFGMVHHLILWARTKFVTANKVGVKDALLDGHEGANPSTARRWLNRFIASSLYALGTASAFLNMLIAMTYNVGLFIAICVGEAVGFFLFTTEAQSLTSAVKCSAGGPSVEACH